MLRDTGLHAAIAIALVVLVGVILENPAVGGAAGLLAGALVTWKWPPRPVDVHGQVELHGADEVHGAVDETGMP